MRWLLWRAWGTFRKANTIMALSMQERKAAQRSRPEGYAKSRECDWRMQGIREANYVSFLAKLTIQNFRCPICSCAIGRRASLDHNHATGAARSVLCNTCNLLLGKVEKGDSLFLEHAADYLRSWSEQ